MTVRKGNAVLLGKFPRSHEGMTPFSVQDELSAADIDEDQVLLAAIPANFAIKNVVGAIKVFSDAIGVAVVADLGIGKADGVVIKVLIAAMDLSTGGQIEYAVLAGEESWTAAVDGGGDQLYLILDITTATTPGAGSVQVGGDYAAGLDRIVA